MSEADDTAKWQRRDFPEFHGINRGRVFVNGSMDTVASAVFSALERSGRARDMDGINHLSPAFAVTKGCDPTGHDATNTTRRPLKRFGIVGKAWRLSSSV